MNEEYVEKLLDRCRGAVVWRGQRGNEHHLTSGQIGFAIWADHVESWIRELESILETLRRGQLEDYDPQRNWTPAAWLAYYTGKVAAIDVNSTGRLGSISASERDSTPGFEKFRRLFDEANDLCFLQRAALDPNALRALSGIDGPQGTKYPEADPGADPMILHQAEPGPSGSPLGPFPKGRWS
jgi:hypothetical protein